MKSKNIGSFIIGIIFIIISIVLFAFTRVFFTLIPAIFLFLMGITIIFTSLSGRKQIDDLMDIANKVKDNLDEESSQSTCLYCGSKLEANIKKCPNCGATNKKRKDIE